MPLAEVILYVFVSASGDPRPGLVLLIMFWENLLYKKKKFYTGSLQRPGML
jgi:hypothetical protein